MPSLVAQESPHSREHTLATVLWAAPARPPPHTCAVLSATGAPTPGMGQRPGLQVCASAGGLSQPRGSQTWCWQSQAACSSGQRPPALHCPKAGAPEPPSRLRLRLRSGALHLRVLLNSSLSCEVDRKLLFIILTLQRRKLRRQWVRGLIRSEASRFLNPEPAAASSERHPCCRDRLHGHVNEDVRAQQWRWAEMSAVSVWGSNRPSCIS